MREESRARCLRARGVRACCLCRAHHGERGVLGAVIDEHDLDALELLVRGANLGRGVVQRGQQDGKAFGLVMAGHDDGQSH